MACDSSYAARIRQRHCVGARAETPAIQYVRADERRPSSGLGGSGQSAFAGLYSLSNHCWARQE